MKEKIKQIFRLLINFLFGIRVPLPKDILDINAVFTQNGYKLYVVGGAVRDAVLGKMPKDYDLATDALPDKVEEIMAAAGFRTLPTGKAFGVINVFTDQGEYEIATFRNDVGTDGRRPDTVVFTTIEGDVERRDLTMNALFYDIVKKKVIDLVGGIKDIKNRIVRTVGAPEDRFGEDRLRILRAIRFAGRFGSDLDAAIDAVLVKDASLDKISGERIRDEFIKGIVSAKSVFKYLKMLDKYKLFDSIFRGLKVNKTFIDDKDVIVVIAELLKDNDVDTIGKVLNELKYSVEEIKAIKFLISLKKLSVETAVTLKKAQVHAGVSIEQMKKFSKLEGISSKLLEAFIIFELSVTGQEVMDKMGLKAGPELGKAIHAIETENFKKTIRINQG